MTKTCNRCGVSKPLDDKHFYRNPGMRDGYRNVCNVCEIKRAREHRKNPRVKARILRYLKKYNQIPEKRRKKDARTLLHNARYPQKAQARQAVRNAISRGKLQRQPCEVCGKLAEAHHEDYSKPFDIQWFCFKHHREYHNKQKESISATI